MLLPHHDTTTKAGGVAFYNKKTLDFQLINNVSIGMNSVEDLWIEIQTKSKPFLIRVIYRYPINLKPELEFFSTQLYNILTELHSKHNSFYVLGDFHINLMQTNNNFVESYLNNILRLLCKCALYVILPLNKENFPMH